MKYAIIADIHGNWEALQVVLEDIKAQKCTHVACLGDVVGYGADPEWTVDTVMALVEKGAMIVRGNHDNAIGSSAESMNAEAQAAIEWTRGRLSAEQRHIVPKLEHPRARAERGVGGELPR